ncbi:MAG: hypothetical protein FD147_97 [Chloroflexi bacterium]|nr:MAG: hypothetical protein FD147_97 [Chloroflexota bacterium]MBA4374725.1 hypothetical protein [Anaerolinea sp.]
MKKKEYYLLYLIAVIFFALITIFQKVPGYMDAEYYYGQSIQIVYKNGLFEPFIWNYLNHPAAVPVPAFSFWMPLTSLISSIGLVLMRTEQFYAARLPFVLLAGLVPVISAYFAEEFLPDKRAGWIAGSLALFSGLYLPYLTLTDTFTPYMVLGGIFFLLVFKMIFDSRNRFYDRFGYFGLGLIVGLLNLTRTDGILWLIAGILSILIINYKDRPRNELVWSKFIDFIKLALGFAIIMLPWFLRNYLTFQSIFPPGNSYVIWFTKYDDLFTYPAEQLTFIRWIDTGIGSILIDRFIALGSNLQTLIAVGGGIILFPFMVIGIWIKRNHQVIIVMIVMLLTLLGLMSFVFPYAGERGGFFHSLASMQIIFWSLVPLGLHSAVNFGVKLRKWDITRSWKLFGITLIAVMCLFSAFYFIGKISIGQEGNKPWNETQDNYLQIEQKIDDLKRDKTGIVMVNNPPGYFLATGRSAIVIPAGGIDAIANASIHYKAKYIIVDNERLEVKALLTKEILPEWQLEKLFEFGDSQVYEIKQ